MKTAPLKFNHTTVTQQKYPNPHRSVIINPNPINYDSITP